MKLAIYYHRYMIGLGTPICVSNGRSEIYTDKVILENVTGQVIFNSTKGPGLHLTRARRHGTTTPLELEISPAPEDEIPKVIRTDKKIIILNADQKKSHALKERERYRNLHPEVKRGRRESWE